MAFAGRLVLARTDGYGSRHRAIYPLEDARPDVTDWNRTLNDGGLKPQIQPVQRREMPQRLGQVPGFRGESIPCFNCLYSALPPEKCLPAQPSVLVGSWPLSSHIPPPVA